MTLRFAGTFTRTKRSMKDYAKVYRRLGYKLCQTRLARIVLLDLCGKLLRVPCGAVFELLFSNCPSCSV